MARLRYSSKPGPRKRVYGKLGKPNPKLIKEQLARNYASGKTIEEILNKATPSQLLEQLNHIIDLTKTHPRIKRDAFELISRYPKRLEEKEVKAKAIKVIIEAEKELLKTKGFDKRTSQRFH